MKGCSDTCPGESSQQHPCPRGAFWATLSPMVTGQLLPSGPVALRAAVTSQVPGRQSWALAEPPGHSPGGPQLLGGL